ncbi:hypothetical protein HS1genome_2041 [Sulfodiicoccus acidiphilus]|uniref:Thermopsin n=1 Tax=Sulfodiicoccus acidiphilus TaxID=1670455 RepID=A0A348B650_9CREN|nr:hypothetical protein HS1genome_2041 [Sulfodiicoccus acidiphilus]GGU02037.1 hypothetical protein GCM10007116_18940 [Sulfodiicoccus acidiphilus]
MNSSTVLYVFTPYQYVEWAAGGLAEPLLSLRLSPGVNTLNLSRGNYTLVVLRAEPNQVTLNLTPYWSVEELYVAPYFSVQVSVGSKTELYAFTEPEFQVWEMDGPAQPSYNFTLLPGRNTVDVGPGTYVFVALNVTRANFTLLPQYPVLLNLLFQQESQFPPVGVSALGLYNYSGTLVPYTVTTDEVLGFFNVSTLEAVELDDPQVRGATIQLNVMLNGSGQYWLQDVLSLLTGNQTTYLDFNVWNASAPNASLRGVKGTGSFVLGTQGQRVFAGSTYPIVYHLPFAGYLDVKESPVEGGTNVTFGYVILQDGDLVPPIQRWFAWVFVPVRGELTVSPFTAGDGSAEDAELVVGGISGGDVSQILASDVRLALFYYNEGITPFPAVYGVGLDTLEGATGVGQLLSANGLVVLVPGVPLNYFLTDHFSPAVPTTYVTVVNWTKAYSLYLRSPFVLEFPPNFTSHGLTYKLVKIETVVDGRVVEVNDSFVEVTPSPTFQNVTIVAVYRGPPSLQLWEFLVLAALVSGTVLLARRRRL